MSFVSDQKYGRAVNSFLKPKGKGISWAGNGTHKNQTLKNHFAYITPGPEGSLAPTLKPKSGFHGLWVPGLSFDGTVVL